MKSSLVSNYLSYLILVAIAGLFLPISKNIIALIICGVYFLFFIYTALSKPSAAFYFLVFITVPIAAFIIPSPIPRDIPPLLQLAIAVGMWSFILSLIVSIGALAASYSQRRSIQPATSPVDHAPKSHS